MSHQRDQSTICASALNEEVIATPNGDITIYPRCSPGFFSILKLDAGIGNFSHYSSIIQKFEVFERVVSAKDGRVALAVKERDTVVGYLVCWYPEAAERWSKLGDLMYEMGAVEVSRNFRHMNIAQKMISLILADDFFEDKIAYINVFLPEGNVRLIGVVFLESVTLEKVHHHFSVLGHSKAASVKVPMPGETIHVGDLILEKIISQNQ